VAWKFWCDPLLNDVRLIVWNGAAKEEIARLLPPTAIPICEKPFETDLLLELLGDCTKPQ
jgi:hypothetical protein